MQKLVSFDQALEVVGEFDSVTIGLTPRSRAVCMKQPILPEDDDTEKRLGVMYAAVREGLTHAGAKIN